MTRLAPELDIRCISTDDLAGLHDYIAVETAAALASRADWTAKPVAARVAELRDDTGWAINIYVGYVDGTPVAAMTAHLPTTDNTDKLWLLVDVHPDHWRCGYGTAMIAHAERDIPPTRSEILTYGYTPTTPGAEAGLVSFARRSGFVLAAQETTFELSAPWPTGQPPTVPAGYEVFSYVNGVPADRLASYCRILGQVDAEAPSGTVVFEASQVSVDDYSEELAHELERGMHRCESLAIAPDGSVAAMTRVSWYPQDAERYAVQGDTYVVPEYRRKGLAEAVKLANLAALNTAAPQSGSVKTTVNDDNESMIALNAKLGFVPLERELMFTKAVQLTPAV